MHCLNELTIIGAWNSIVLSGSFIICAQILYTFVFTIQLMTYLTFEMDHTRH